MTLITVTQGLMPFQFEDLTRDERILAVIAIGAATVVVLHFGLFELPRLWRTLLDELRRLRARQQPEPSDVQRRRELDTVVVPFTKRIS